MVVKTFRGVLADGGQDQIKLSTMQGKVGYKIIKFLFMPTTPGTDQIESVVKIYRTYQTSITNTVDFTDSDLLAAHYMVLGNNIEPQNTVIILDHEIFNQDIYITHVDVDSAFSITYVVELETIPLTDLQAEYATIKDLRSNA